MSLVTTLKRRVTKPWERTRVTGDRGERQPRADEPAGHSAPRPLEKLWCSLASGGRSGLGRASALCSDQACLGDAPQPEPGPRPTVPRGSPSPSRAPTCLRGQGGIGGSSFTFPAFTLSHHLGVRVLRPPSHEPAEKTGSQVSRSAGAHEQTKVGALLASETSSLPPPPPPHQGQALDRNCPHLPCLSESEATTGASSWLGWP